VRGVVSGCAGYIPEAEQRGCGCSKEWSATHAEAACQGTEDANSGILCGWRGRFGRSVSLVSGTVPYFASEVDVGKELYCDV
jgi:hypothetical protein